MAYFVYLNSSEIRSQIMIENICDETENIENTVLRLFNRDEVFIFLDKKLKICFVSSKTDSKSLVEKER